MRIEELKRAETRDRAEEELSKAKLLALESKLRSTKLAEEEAAKGRRHEEDVDKMAKNLYDTQQAKRQAADAECGCRKEALEADEEFVKSVRERLTKDEDYAEKESESVKTGGGFDNGKSSAAVVGDRGVEETG